MEDDAQEQQSTKQPRTVGGTLANLADIRLGPVSLNLRILLEPIGFLRIILLILSIFAFSLTAGYVSLGDSSQARCVNAASNNNVTVTVFASYSYPFGVADFSFRYQNVNPPPSTLNCTREILMGDRPLSGSAAFYVAITVLTFLYCLVILPVYVFVYTVTLDFSKYIAIVDCAVSVGASVFLFFADVAWSAGTTNLSVLVADTLRSHAQNCLNCAPPPTALTVDVQSTVQLSFSLLFGWIMLAIWIVSIWFSYKETIIHINKMGPLYVYVPKLIYKVKGGQSSQGTGGGGEEGSKDDEP